MNTESCKSTIMMDSRSWKEAGGPKWRPQGPGRSRQSLAGKDVLSRLLPGKHPPSSAARESWNHSAASDCATHTYDSD